MDIKNIVVIDDDAFVLDLLKIFIEDQDCKVLTATTAEQGLSIIRKNEHDMVLLDINLPDGDGLTVLKKIKEISSEIPVIMITGGSDIQVAEECMEHGAADYISKPFDFEYLKTSIISNFLGA